MVAAAKGGARELARRVLLRVRRDEAYATLALAGELERQPELPGADRALATELCYGVLRRQGQLDALLSARLSRPLEKVDPDLLDILRLAAYQLLALDRVPAYAAVDEAVRAARRLRGQRAGGFVNAVLRRLERERGGEVPRTLEQLLEELPAPRRPAAKLAREASLPLALAQSWLEAFGPAEAAALGHALLQPAPLTLRANGQRTSPEELARILEAEGAAVERARFAPEALHVRDGGSERRWAPGLSPSYHQGLWTMQDEAAQLVSRLLGPRPGERILDACCGLGGKTTHLAELVGATEPAPSILGVDISQRKLELLEEHCLRLGVRCETRCHDLGELEDTRFQRILLDAPCSGLGVLRRHPELKWRGAATGAERQGELVELQRRLLHGALRLLAPGGCLVYAVCTVSPAEGPEQREWLLAEYPELRLATPEDPAVASLAPSGELALWPQHHGTDGFYAVRLVKEE